MQAAYAGHHSVDAGTENHHKLAPVTDVSSSSVALTLQGGGLRDSFLVDGVAFKKTFSYAGFEMQPKQYEVGGWSAQILMVHNATAVVAIEAVDYNAMTC